MPTYEYECKKCGLRFERQQPITDRPLTECPECDGEVRRLVSGGAGFIIKGAGRGRMERSGKPCCGRDGRCRKPPYGDKE